jgi:hypothetical protein
MRSKSRFTTLVLLETLESYLQIPVQSLCTLRGLSPGATQHLLPSGRFPYSDRSSTGWIAPAWLAHLFDHLVGAGEKRWGQFKTDRLGAVRRLITSSYLVGA